MIAGIANSAMNIGVFAIVQSRGNTLHDFKGFGKQVPCVMPAIALNLLLLAVNQN